MRDFESKKLQFDLLKKEKFINFKKRQLVSRETEQMPLGIIMS